MVLKSFCERIIAAKFSTKSSVETVDNNQVPASLKAGTSDSKFPKASLWSGFFPSGFSVSEIYNEPSASEKKTVHSNNSGWAAVVTKVVTSGSMRRFQERVLGTSKTDISSADGDIWLLGVCHKFSHHESTGNVASSNVFAEFEQDFSSKILLTYRKGRSWRKNVDKPLDKEYIEILQLFGDSEASSFSIHNLLQAGQGHGLAVGSWVGPYAMCRTWEVLARNRRETNDLGEQPLPMAIYVVSGDEDGERGGAPVVCIDDASKRCSEFSKGLVASTPLLLLVPLVLGLDKVNPRYIPLLQSTFKFPQSLGILGGKPGASTYIIGVQNDKALYLDPHDAQPVVNINGDTQEVNTSSYHCNIIRHLPLDSVDPSLAIGFYCRDKDDFDDFCFCASKLAEESNGAPLFTVAQSRSSSGQVPSDDVSSDKTGFQGDDSLGVDLVNDAGSNEDDWQLL